MKYIMTFTADNVKIFISFPIKWTYPFNITKVNPLFWTIRMCIPYGTCEFLKYFTFFPYIKRRQDR